MEDYYTIQTPCHHSNLFAELHTLQKQGVLCDVILAAEDGEVMAHKVILMAASKYFRHKLAPVVSTNQSRICLKGISVVELANLVKYIYTGKLLVAKETMDVTLEVSEILGLNGVVQGYKEIITYEQMKADGNVSSASSETGDGHGHSETQTNIVIPPAVNVKDTAPDSDTSISGSLAEGAQLQNKTSATNTLLEPTAASVMQAQDIRVTEYCEDGTTITYSVEQTEQSGVGTSHTPNEYQFEFNPYDQQYMDVSVGANAQTSSTNLPKLQKMTTVTKEQRAADEQAQHQDLLAVAIETLSDSSHFIGNLPRAIGEMDTAVSNIASDVEESSEDQTVAVSFNANSNTADIQDYHNGKIESKIVTLSAGKVSNELGGQTSVYTVALDPSTITKPLQMPRILRKKSEKEKQAEKAAKMYRKKKAELLNRPTMITPVAQGEEQQNYRSLIDQTILADKKIMGTDGSEDKDEFQRKRPRILLRSSSPRGKEILQPDKSQHILIRRSQDGIITTQSVTSSDGQMKPLVNLGSSSEYEDAKGDFGQVVNFDLDEDEIGNEKINQEKDSNADNLNKIEKSVPLKSATNTTSSVKSVVLLRTRGAAKKEMEKLQAEFHRTTDVSKSTENISTQNNDLKYDNKLSDVHEDAQLESFSKSDTQSPSPDHLDAQISDRIRSSATKRKGKVPRRLPLLDDSESPPDTKKNNIPMVRTRRSSRNEGGNGSSKTGKGTKVKSLNTDDTKSKADESDNKDKDITKIAKMDEISEEDKQVKQSESEPPKDLENLDIINPEENMLMDKASSPEVRLKKHTNEEMLGLARKLASTSPKKKHASTIEIEIETFEPVEDCDSKTAKCAERNEVCENDEGGENTEEDIDLEMTVDSIDTDKEDGSAKRKADNENEPLTRKRAKTGQNKFNQKVSSNSGENLQTEPEHLGKRWHPSEKNSKSSLVNVSKSPATAVKDTRSKKDKKSTETSNLTDRSVPTEKESYVCPEKDCIFESMTMSGIGKHRSTFHGTKQQNIPTPVLTPDDIKKEKEETDSRPLLICSCCNLSFRTQAKLQEHCRKQLAQAGNGKCEICEEVFTVEFDLFCHQFKIHDIPIPKLALSYGCPVCNHVANKIKSIDLHMATHEGSNIECMKCDKRFKTYIDLKKHLISHSEKRFKCPHCDFMSNVMACVNTHVRLKHSKLKDVVSCQFCDYKTPLRGNLRKHMLSAHLLIVVTKQSVENKEKYKDIEEGTLLTIDGKLFDPSSMPLPKMSYRSFSEEDRHRKMELKQKGVKEKQGSEKIKKEKVQKDEGEKRSKRPALYKLPPDEFTKELLKRHEEYLKKPERQQKFMSHSLAVATEHPSFPQASPNVRSTKANKIYNTPKLQHRFQELTPEVAQHYLTEGTSSVPTVSNEIEIIQNESPLTIVSENVAGDVQTVLSIQEASGMLEEEQLILVTKDGRESVMPTRDFYKALVDKENSMETKETIGVINALLAAGQEVQIQERDVSEIEIQNE